MENKYHLYASKQCLSEDIYKKIAIRAIVVAILLAILTVSITLLYVFNTK